jgi:predicted transcriptional regulator
MKNKNNNNQWVSSIRKLLPVINILHSKDPSVNVDKLCLYVSHLLLHKGEERTIELLKQHRLSFQQYVLRQTVTNVPFSKKTGIGLPKRLNFLKPDRDNRSSIMYTLSVLRLIEEFRSKPKYSVDTIIAPTKAKIDNLDEIKAYIRSNPRILKVLPKEPMEPRLFLSNKAGPNGPASITCLQDLTALRAEGSEALYSAINQFIKDNLVKVDVDKYENASGEFKHSKLVLLSDKACKTRVIAIADWWSNVCLSGIHDTFMKGLRRLPNDVTYFQDKIPSFVHKMGSNLYSSDMTAFTDRFPIELETEVLKQKYGSNVADMWTTLISDREFYHKNGSVRYQVGNPMGLLSSWAVSTFTHHVVKAWCAHKCGIKYGNYKYLILGDDTLDSRKDVYNMYIQTIQDLGVDISISKCTQSESGFAEFAKRLFSPDGEVTGLPVHLLNGLKSNPEQVLELVRICRSRGYEDSVLGPALEVLLEKDLVSQPKLIADILSLPEYIVGAPPLLEGNTTSMAGPLFSYGETYGKKVLAIARQNLFWRLIEKIQISQGPKHVSPIEIDNNHPLVFTLNERIDRYLPEAAFCDDTWEEDELYL